MRNILLPMLGVGLLSCVVACARSPEPSVVYPLGSLGEIDSLTVLVHVEHPCAGVSGDTLKQEVLEALDRAGIVARENGPPYLHVRAYSRAGTSTVFDDEPPRGPPASWHFGMWIDNTMGYNNVNGPLTNLCPAESALWWRGGSGLLAEGMLLDSVQIWLSEFVSDYRATNARHASIW